jgi:enoyl-CoA hydratase/carnithine racemase
MDHLQLTANDGLLTIRLARPKANAINSALLSELRDTFLAAAADASVRGVLVGSAIPGIFSAGFDAREVFTYDAAEIRVFFAAFVELCHAMLDFHKPLVGAIDGHAIAGGAILALACDARVFGDGPYGFGVNEINLGLVVSEDILRMAVAIVGAGPARELILEGITIQPARAYEVGLANELAPPAEVMARAEARARALMEKPPQAFAAIKRLFRDSLVPSPGEPLKLDSFVAHWTSTESTSRRQQLAASLRR